MSLCRNCQSADARPTEDLCPACYMYRRRTGQDRPEDLIIRHNIRRLEDQIFRRRLIQC